MASSASEFRARFLTTFELGIVGEFWLAHRDAETLGKRIRPSSDMDELVVRLTYRLLGATPGTLDPALSGITPSLPYAVTKTSMTLQAPFESAASIA